MGGARPEAGRSFAFPRRMRLTRGREFLAVRHHGRRAAAGPLLVYALPNELEHPRLGLSISRRVGKAVQRNRIKRLVREAFRLGWCDWALADRDGRPARYDLIVSAKAHEPLSVPQYQRLLDEALHELHRTWQKKPPPRMPTAAKRRPSAPPKTRDR